MSKFKRVALITGTSSGFGMLLSIALAKKGIQVIASMRNVQRETALHQYIKREKIENIEIVELDVTDYDQIPIRINSSLQQYGKIDILINNAGYAAGGLAEDVSMEVYREQLETNFFGLVAVTKAVIPFMRKQRSGKIINISSVSGRIGFPGLSPYVSSKFAVEGFSECLRLELLSSGVYVTLVEPGAYKTDIWSKGFVDIESVSNSADESVARNIVGEVENAANNAGDPQEVMDLVSKIVDIENPKLRYVIGKGMKRGLFLRKVLPQKWLEGMIVKKITKDN